MFDNVLSLFLEIEKICQTLIGIENNAKTIIKKKR